MISCDTIEKMLRKLCKIVKVKVCDDKWIFLAILQREMQSSRIFMMATATCKFLPIVNGRREAQKVCILLTIGVLWVNCFYKSVCVVLMFRMGFF